MRVTEEKTPFYKKIPVEVWFFLILIGYLFNLAPEPLGMHQWLSTAYLINYDTGFVSRGLPGSILSFFLPYLRTTTLYFVIFISNTLLSIFTALLLGTVVRRSGEMIRNVVLFLAFLFCVNPGSVAYLFGWYNYGRYDLYLITIAFTCFFIVLKKRMLFLIPILTVLGMLTHHVMVFIYLPAIILFMIYDCYHSEKRKIKMALIALTFVIGCVLFFIAQFRGKIQGYNIAAFVSKLYQRTDLSIGFRGTIMINYEYFLDVPDAFRYFILPHIKRLSQQSIFLVMLLSPMLMVLGYIWKQAIRKAAHGFEKWMYRGMAFHFIVTAPAFIMACDWGRWVASILICEFLLIFFLICKKDPPMLEAVESLGQLYAKNPTPFIFILCFQAALGKFEAETIMDWLMKLFAVFRIFS
jgi:hypothetical protein